MGFIDNIKSKVPWLFGSHYGIERFAVLLAVLTVLMATCSGSILIKHKNDQKEQLGFQVVYSTRFTMSKSKASGDVVSVNVSNDRTKALVLLKYDDPTRMSTDAKDYQIFLTGSDTKQHKTDLLCSPDGTIYVFGNSGYVALYLVDSAGFQSQILDLVLRSDNEFESGEALADEYDGSFVKFDQCRIYFNPGGSASITVDCLEDNDMSPYHIYESVLVKQQEAVIKGELEDTLDELKQAQAHITAATKTVQDKGLQIPMTPYEIAGDTVTVDENGNTVFFAASYLPGSYQVDWQNGSIATGYLADAMMAEGYTDEITYFSDKTSAQAGNPGTISSANVEWYKVDGTRVEYSPSGNVREAERLMNDAMESLVSAWDEFYQAKVKYTVSLPAKLLDLEVTSSDMTSNYTVRSFADDAVGENQTVWVY